MLQACFPVFLFCVDPFITLQNCEVTNAMFANPCWVSVKGQLKKYYEPTSRALFIICMGVFLAVTLNWAQCGLLRQRALQVNARLVRKASWAVGSPDQEQKWAMVKADNVLNNLNGRERDALRDEFKKVDKNGDGKLDAEELQKFYRHVCEIQLTPEEVWDGCL